MIESIIDWKPTCASSCSTTTSPFASASTSPMSATSATFAAAAIGIVPGGIRRSGCSFSQPRLTIITSPPKFGLRLMLRTVRIGTIASGASIATPQP